MKVRPIEATVVHTEKARLPALDLDNPSLPKLIVIVIVMLRRPFPTGGQITVLSGISADSGSSLTGITVFKITPGGKKLEPS
jgi:hypothetical protein